VIEEGADASSAWLGAEHVLDRHLAEYLLELMPGPVLLRLLLRQAPQEQAHLPEDAPQVLRRAAPRTDVAVRRVRVLVQQKWASPCVMTPVVRAGVLPAACSTRVA